MRHSRIIIVGAAMAGACTLTAAALLARPLAHAAKSIMGETDGTCPKQAASQLTVETAAELQTVANCARAGTTILLKGRQFGRVMLRNVNGLIIKSADADAPATFEMLAIRQSKDIFLAHLRFGGANTGLRYRLEIGSAQNITASDLDFPGTPGRTDDVSDAAVHVRLGNTITLRRMKISWTVNGIGFIGANDLSIEDNVIRDVRTDGIRGGGASHLVIARNYIGNIRSLPGDHPDAIQLWSTNEKESARDIRIIDNLYERGVGNPAQGIFVRDGNLQLPFENIEIANNVIVGSMWNGITVSGGRNVEIRGNSVLPLPDQHSWFRIEHVENASVVDNRGVQMLLDSGLTARRTKSRKPTPDEIRQSISNWKKRTAEEQRQIMR